MDSRFQVLIPNRKWLVKAAAVSVVAHFAVLGGYLVLGERVKEVVHSITFEPPPPPSVFWKPPRTTARVLEFRKQPVPKGVYLRQKDTVAKTKLSQVQAQVAMRTEALLNQLDISKIASPSLQRRAGLSAGAGAAVETGFGGLAVPLPELSSVEVVGVKETSQQVDMRLDMLSIRDMDTGQYHAMVVQDPDDRRKVKGFIHLAQAFTRSRASILEASGSTAGTQQGTKYQSLDFLIKALNEYTGIEADYLGPIPLNDPRLMEVPWLLLPGSFGEMHSMTDREIENFGRYLAGGGFALTVAGNRFQTNTEKMAGTKFDIMRRALKSQGLNEGADWRFVWLKPGHPLYHSYFDFDMAVRDNSTRQELGDLGLVVGERLAAFISTAKKIATEHGTAAFDDQQGTTVDGTRHLQFTVNTIVFALTQEGGVTQQLMAGVK